MTKRKIKDCIKKCQNNIKFGKSNTALAQLYKKEIIKINFENIRKIAHYSIKKYALLRVALEISIDAGACNYIKHAKIYPIWKSLISGSGDQPWNIKENMVPEQDSVTEDEEEPL